MNFNDINLIARLAGYRKDLPVPVLADSGGIALEANIQLAPSQARECTVTANDKLVGGGKTRGGQFICLGQIVAAEAQVSGDEAAGNVGNGRASAAPEQFISEFTFWPMEGPEFNELTRREQEKLAPDNQPTID